MRVNLNANLSAMIRGRRDGAASPVGNILQKAAVSSQTSASRRAPVSRRGDRVSISREGRQSGQGSYLETLMKRQSELEEMRKQLTARQRVATTDTERDMLNGKIKDVNEQIAGVAQQITDYLLEQQKKAAEGQEKKDKDGEKSPEERQAEQTENLTEMSAGFETMSRLRQTRLELKRSLAYEQDAMENVHSVSAGGMARELDAHQSRAARLEEGIRGLESSESRQLEKVRDVLEKERGEARAPVAEEREKAGEAGEAGEGKGPQEAPQNGGKAGEAVRPEQDDQDNQDEA